MGWAVDAVPPLKGGSTIGIPSPPAIWWCGENEIVTPDIRDAERLQGFPADWTLPPEDSPKERKGIRWKLVGNAVSVPIAQWIGNCFLNPRCYDAWDDVPLRKKDFRWPKAAWGAGGKVFEAKVSMWPVREEYQHLAEFLDYPLKPLSERATAGFLKRARSSSLRFPEGFIDAVSKHLESAHRVS